MNNAILMRIPLCMCAVVAASILQATVPYDGPAWPDAEVAFVPDAESRTSPVPAAQRSFDVPVTSAVRTVDGVPRFFVNGEELPIYWGSVNTGIRKDHLPRLAGLPYNVVTVRVSARGVYSGKNLFDEDFLSKRLELFATNNPNCYFVYDVTVNPFRDWAKAHPDELCRDETGELTQDERHVNWSLGSETAMGAITNFITRVITWTESSKWANRIIAYRINSAHTTEWLGWQAKRRRLIDFSPAAERSFRAYATAKYGERFAAATIPTRAERGEPNGRILWNPRDHLAVTAFNEWCSDTMADRMIAACSHAKRLLGGRKAVGTYFGYAMTLFSTGDAQTRAHYALKKVIDAHAVDFLCSPQDYGLRTLGENAIDMKPFATLSMNGILSVIEDDTRTHNGRSLGVFPKGQSQTFNAYQSAAVLRRNFAFYLCRNQPIYQYDLNLGTGLDFPEWRRDAAALREAQVWAARHRVGRHARVAVVSGEGTALVMPRLTQNTRYSVPSYGLDGKATMTVRERGLCTGELMTLDLSRLSRLGTPVDYLLAEDLADHPGDYDVYVFLGCFHSDPRMIAAVRKLQQRPCTLLWTYAPGYVKGIDGSADNMRELTGFDFGELEGAREPLAAFGDGRTMGTPGVKVAPLFAAKGDRVLAHYAKGGEPAVVEKRVGRSRSIYSGVCLYDAAFLRRIVRDQKVFAYVDSDDPVEANDRFFALHARTPGLKKVRLPFKADVWDVFNRRFVARNADAFSFDAPIHSSWLFRYVPHAGEPSANPAAEKPGVSFAAARPVWAKGMEKTMNANVRFRSRFTAKAGDRPFVRVTGTSVYRIRLNGRHVGYGPARAAAGYFRVDEWPLSAVSGVNELDVEVCAYNCNNYYVPCQPPFLQAEVVCGGAVLCATGRARDFTATATERITKVPRYSGQRAFSEVYRHDGRPLAAYELVERPPVRLLPRIAPYPPFAVNDRLKIVSRATAAYDPNRLKKKYATLEPDEDDILRARYRKDEFEANGWRDGAYLSFKDRVPYDRKFPADLKSGESIMVDAGLNDCGFFAATVEVAQPGRFLLTFDEILSDGEVNPARMSCCNVVEWIFEKPGKYEVETLEPYVWRYANMIALDGEMTVTHPFVRTYKNGEVGRAEFKCSDPALGRIFAAAKETFAQNAVDVFTDCPSRERAGWLCDSFFIGRVNKLLTGHAGLERLFLENYLLPEGFPHLPRGMVPMCYPADQWAGIYIPNWAMWLVLETEEYLARSGDRATVDALRPRLQGIVDFLHNFRNREGLLEKLPSWVFVEWSAANKLVQEVNYPSNMAFAEVLDVMDRLYGIPRYAQEAKNLREAVRRKSWNGQWFCDNARYSPDGSLVNTGYCTEVCQYYAFFFRTATPESHPDLWRRLVNDFGPNRKQTGLHPEIWPANAFIGNYLRLELLAREGRARQILEESKGFFLYMADRTGTLWEHNRSSASCDHGFASHIAVSLYRDILGVKAVDAARRKVRVEPPSDIDLDWCEGTIPVSPTEVLTVAWRRGEQPTVAWR